MKWKTKDGLELEMWEIGYVHLTHLITYLEKSLEKYNNKYKGGLKTYPSLRYSNSFYRSLLHHIKQNKLLILFLKRELKYRDDYPEYKSMCEQLSNGQSTDNDRGGITIIKMTTDTTFLSAFSDWCQDHNMMVQSRKIQRKIDRFKCGRIVEIT